jgi:hypothetical protein
MEIHIKSSGKSADFLRQGKTFLEAAWRCFGKKTDTGFQIVENGKFQQLSAPCVVNAAFACEMFLKSLLFALCIHFNPQAEGHNLYLLYKKLPRNIQEIIAKICWNRKMIEFENLLKEHAKDFVDVRYFIEKDSWTEMSPITVITIADNLSRVVEYLLNNTNWEEIQ